MKDRRVVVTGLGALTPLGNNVNEYWESLEKGVSGAAPINNFDASKFKTRFACELKNYDPKEHFDRKELRKIDPFTQYALIAVKEAIEHSGAEIENMDSNRAGVIWGSGIGGLQTFYEEVKNFAEGDGTPRFNPFFIPKMIIDIAAGHISMKFGLQGVNYATVSACASSGNAIAEAYNYIQHDKADLIVTGGSEAVINPVAIGGFNSMKALSERNDEYQTASRPFDQTRDGFVMGEGSGAFILEELESAKKRGATIYAEIVGSGMSADAYHITAPDPDGVGARAVMENALKDAGIDKEKIGYINVHGTSTPLGDKSELKAIKEVFGDQAYNLNISSTKSMHGHLLGAAGSIEAIASLLPLRKGVIPPTINHQHNDPEIDDKLNLTFNEAQEKKIDYIMSNAFGFGGHNVSLILKKFAD